MNTFGLTHRQADLLRFIAAYQFANDGISPSYRECLAAIGHTGSSKSTIHWLMTALEERGHIRRLRGRARAIRILRDVPVSTAPDGTPLIFIPIPPAGRRPAHVETAAPANRILSPFHAATNTTGHQQHHVAR